MGDAVGLHLYDRVGNEGVPVAHADVDLAGGGFFKEFGLAEGPAGKGRALGQRLFFQADFGITVLELGDDVGRHGAAAGDVLEVVGHLAEAVGRAVCEEEDGGAAHGYFYGKWYSPLPPRLLRKIFHPKALGVDLMRTGAFGKKGSPAWRGFSRRPLVK